MAVRLIFGQLHCFNYLELMCFERSINYLYHWFARGLSLLIKLFKLKFCIVCINQTINIAKKNSQVEMCNVKMKSAERMTAVAFKRMNATVK